MIKILPSLEPNRISESTILIVPSTDHPPRVPKLLTAIAYGMKIVDFKWVLEQNKSAKQIKMSDYEMKY